MFNFIPQAELKQNFREFYRPVSEIFKLQTIKKHYSDSENPFNLDYFAYFNLNYVKFLFKDIIKSEKLRKKVKLEINNNNKLSSGGT